MNIEKDILQRLTQQTKKTVTKKNLIKDLEIDSLDLVELIVEYEEKYKISISDNELMNIKSVEDIILLFEKYSK